MSRRTDNERFQLGAYWLSTNRHGYWCRTWYDKTSKGRQTRRVTLGTRDFEGAKLALAAWVTLHERLDQEDPADVPLAPILDRYYDRHAKDLASAEGAASHIKILKAAFPDDTVADLTLDRQLEALEQPLRDAGKSNGYIGRIQTTLQAALNFARKKDELARVPYIRVLSGGKRTRVLSLKEAAALFNAPGLPDHLCMLLMLMFCTVSRPGALLQLQPFQIDLERRLITLNPPGRQQTKKFRPVVPIVDTLLPWLQARMSQRYFVQWYDEQTKPIKSVETTWRKIRAAAGLSADVIPYTIRHTMATEMRRRGVPKWEVKGWLGHGGDVTDGYAHFDPDYLARGTTAIDDYMHELQPLVKRELLTNVVPISKGRKA